MSRRWIQDFERSLDQTKELEDVQGRDRLDLVRTIRFTLYALHRNVSDWIEWINNPDIMAGFSLKELKELSKNLSELTQPFIKYDCQITSRDQGDLTTREPETQNESIEKAKEKIKVSYIK